MPTASRKVIVFFLLQYSYFLNCSAFLSAIINQSNYMPILTPLLNNVFFLLLVALLFESISLLLNNSDQRKIETKSLPKE